MYTEEKEKYDNFDIINKLYICICIYEEIGERERERENSAIERDIHF